ncbi:MAG: hypothetical protein J7L19_05455 [Dehalococcoidia bacterium]|nr:hypothetical protein [Dehalococcoidia bacterium]
MAFFQIHPGAIYLHQGKPYLITELDLTKCSAAAMPTSANYYTQAKETADTRIVGTDKEKICHGWRFV